MSRPTKKKQMFKIKKRSRKTIRQKIWKRKKPNRKGINPRKRTKRRVKSKRSQHRRRKNLPQSNKSANPQITKLFCAERIEVREVDAKKTLLLISTKIKIQKQETNLLSKTRKNSNKPPTSSLLILPLKKEPLTN